MILKINMFGALALMPSDKIIDCLAIIRDKAKTLTVDPKKLDTFIICSLCSKNVHYICNNPNVSAYYKKRPINFKCCVCKPIK